MENNSIGTVPKVIAVVVVLALAGAYFMRSPVQESSNTEATTEVSSAEDLSQIERDAAVDIGVDNLDASLDGIDAELGL